METYRQQLPGASSVGFSSRGFDGERVIREISTLHTPGPADADGRDIGSDAGGGEIEGGEVEVMAVHFPPGERTSRHRHARGQVLIVLDGTAEVVTDEGRVVATAGDVVVAAPGEWHWHGAVGDSPMTHLAIHPRGPGMFERSDGGG
jgi:quercetin dioxygenase-like cupin family protein